MRFFLPIAGLLLVFLGGWSDAQQPGERAPLHITGRIHFNINVSDFERSRSFYRLLGFTDGVGGFSETNTLAVAQAVGFDAPYRLHAELAYLGHLPADPIDLTLPTGRFIDLVEWLEPRRPEPPYENLNHLGMTRFALATTNIDADVAYLSAHGVQFLSNPVERADGGRFVILKDPDGTFIELIELPGTRQPAMQGIHVTAVRHVNLNVRDFARAKAFYERLGFVEVSALPPTDRLEVAEAMGFDAPYKIRGAIMEHRADGAAIELVEWLEPRDDEPPYAPPINHLGIHRMNWASEDIAADTQVLEDEGVQFLSPIAPCCTGDTSTFGIVVFQDPDGIFNQLMGSL